MNRIVQSVGSAGLTCLLVLFATFTIPVFVTSPAVLSLATQIMIGMMGAFSVYIMMRMDLMSFAVPAFMAAGGYTAAILGLRFGIIDVFLVAALCFVIPALIALPLGWLVLRLRGVYFVLVTFVVAEIVPLLLFETPTITGGSNGLPGLPAPTLFGQALEDNQSVLTLAIALAVLGAAITIGVTRKFRQHFAAIEEDPVLAQSLGLVVWRYKVIGFCIAAGVAGLSGFALVNMLLTAHPSSFSAISSVNYIAYAIVGGKASILGAVAGSSILVWASNVFSFQGEYSQGLFGLLLIFVVLVAKGGIIGLLHQITSRISLSRHPVKGRTNVQNKVSP